MRDTVLWKQFHFLLSEDDKKQYRAMSINQQKDWYISWLERQHTITCTNQNRGNIEIQTKKA